MKRVGCQEVSIETKLLSQVAKLFEAEHFDEAEVLCGEALTVAPESADAWYAKGMLDERRVALNDAKIAFEKSVLLDPNSGRNNFAYANVLARVDRVADAAEIIERLLVKEPDRADLRAVLSGLKLKLRDSMGAEIEARRAIDLDNSIPEAHLNLALVLCENSRIEEALVACEAAISVDNGFATAHFTSGNVHLALGHHTAAMEAYNKVLELEPEHAGALLNLGNIYRDHLDISTAGAYYERAAAAAPDSAAAHSNLGIVLKDQGNMVAALSEFQRAVALDPTIHQARSNLLFCLCFKTDADPKFVLKEHRKFNDLYAKPLLPASLKYPNEQDPNRHLRIGLISPDLRIHPGGHFFLPIVEGLDREKYEVHCYYNHIVRDEWTMRFERSADYFHQVAHWSDDQLVDRIKSDNIDILLEGAGHMSGNRLLAVAQRPAPVQVAWPLYPNTTGLTAIDYRVLDKHTALPSADEFCTEKIIRLPQTHFCYRPLERDILPATDLPVNSNGYVTFGSFNNAIKLNNLTVETWARILIAVPNSRLILKWLEFDKAGSSTILDRFEKLGIDPTRIERQGWAEDPYTPYQQIDVCLDPILASGGTTTCDALWMGVPVITYAGESVFSRTGLMHMSNIGLPDLIATGVDQYVEIAGNLATDIQHLTNIRLGLRKRMQQSPIMDEAAYCGHLDKEFRKIWRHWCEA